MPRPLLVHAISHLALFAADQHSLSAGEIWVLHTHINLYNINLVCRMSSNTLVSSYISVSSERERDYRSYKIMLPSRDPVVPSQRRSLEIYLHHAWCTISLNVTMSLTKEDKTIWFGQECRLSYLTFGPINVCGAQRWIAHTS